MKGSTLGLAFGGLALAVVLSVAARSEPAGARVRASSESAVAGLRIRWDIVSYNFATTPVTVSAGGEASAKASDRSAIVLTGSGVFGGAPTNVSGGGKWTTLGPTGAVTGSGTYQAKVLVSFYAAPGVFGDATGRYQLADQISDPAAAHAGLATLRIAYSDGSQGVLTISSRQAGTPPSVFMGITATKGSVGYWIHQAAEPAVDGERTLFDTTA